MSSETQQLEGLLYQLRIILQSIPVLEPHGFKPPIIDGDGYNRNTDPIYGLRFFRDSVSKEIEVLEQYLANKGRTREVSTNASYFIAVWNEIVVAPRPIVAIGKEFPLPKTFSNSQKSPKRSNAGVIKVDVVADEGRKWIRVNTIKNSRILAEFREFDSYLTSSEDDGSDDEEGSAIRMPTENDNSLLRMGRALTAASSIPITGTNDRPAVILRLTRLDPNPSDGHTDPRIAQIIDALRDMGIDVQLGELECRALVDDKVTPEITTFRPTRKINLDLSMLIALVSDLSHALLPDTEKEAEKRFNMPANGRTWKLGKGHREVTEISPEEDDFSKHSRALSTQCLQEMRHGLVDEIVERLDTSFIVGETVEFWTTEEARERCIRIVEKIGGEHEKQRARALFPEDDTIDLVSRRQAFWQHSRYPSNYLASILPIHIFSQEHGQIPQSMPSLFWGRLIQTCRHILACDATQHPRLFRKYGEMERAKVSSINTKLTMHTVESMLVGACEGMTTLTANKASVKALLREMKGVKQGDEELRIPIAGEEDISARSLAAIWIVEPRSLAEEMQVNSLPNAGPVAISNSSRE